MKVKRKVVQKNLRKAAKGHAKILKASKKNGGQSLYTQQRGEAFCALLATTAMVSKAAEFLRVSRKTVYDWRNAHKDFAVAWDAALAVGMSRLEDEGVRRSADGIKKAVWYKGRIVGYETIYSDTLLQFMLTAHKPDKYGKSRVEGADGKPLVPAEIAVRFVEAKK